MNIINIVKRPIITEKSVTAASKGVFTFEVNKKANKNQIKEAVEAMYGVDVVSVRTAVQPSKRYRIGKKRQAALAHPTKKALVALKAGQKITLFEQEESN